MLYFCTFNGSWNFKHSIEVAHNEHRNQEYENDVILEGCPISARTSITLPDDVLENAHRYFNTTVAEPFIQ